jgi:preprotein translocase subunit SecA
MNEQRRVIYRLRDQVLEGGSMAQAARDEIAGVIERTIDEYTADEYAEDWDVASLFVALRQIYPVGLAPEQIDGDQADPSEITELVVEDAMAHYDAREAEFGEEVMRALERYLLLTIIDERWREHLYDMDYLQLGIGLRGFAQIEPLVAYKNEAFTLFTDLMNTVWADFARMIFNVQLQVEVPNGAEPPRVYQPGGDSTRAANVTYSQAPAMGARAIGAAAAGTMTAEPELEPTPAFEPVAQRQLSEDQQLGRNDPCWCGSGKKFKRCHGA